MRLATSNQTSAGMTQAGRLIRSYDEKLVLGVYAPVDQTTVCAALIKCSGHGYLQLPEVLAIEQNTLSDTNDFPDLGLPADQRHWLMHGTVERLIASKHCARGLPLVIGLLEPTCLGELAYVEATDSHSASALAERTGLNVVDAFAQRDLAAGGDGAGLHLIPLWQLLADQTGPTVAQPRILLSGDGDCRVTYLPRHTSHQLPPPLQRVVIEEGNDDPGTFDERIAELKETIDGWRKAFPLGAVLWDPAPGNQIDHQVSNHDGFIETVAMRLADTYSCQIQTVTELLHLDATAVLATVAALHAALHVEQLEANQPEISGAQRPRVLGRLTPGSAFAWRRLLKVMTAKSEKLRPLRQAI